MLHPAYILASTAGRISRRLGRGGGTTLPGALLSRWRPEAIREMRDRVGLGSVVLSATNGKTTTTRLTVACLRPVSPVVTNASGANLYSGVVSALLSASRRPVVPARGVFEVDEAALPRVVDQLEPDTLVLMNLFRDQLDRYGELDEIIDRWRAMIADRAPTTRLVVNADDPSLVAIAQGHGSVTWFGINDTSSSSIDLPHASDARLCRQCGAELVYDAVLVGHLGHWRCPDCGLSRPTPTVAAERVVINGLRSISMHIRADSEVIDVSEMPLPGLHNAYNATAAAAVAHVHGIAARRIGSALQSGQAAFGRSERLTLRDRELVLLLIKNPVGANEIVRTLSVDPDPLDLLLILNDRTADGRDVSWIWDVDYEPLLPRVRRLTVAGDRAYDLALRFRYAGFAMDKLHIVPAPAAALDDALDALPSGRPLYALPTYTAMLELRKELVSRGVAQEFWRDV